MFRKYRLVMHFIFFLHDYHCSTVFQIRAFGDLLYPEIMNREDVCGIRLNRVHWVHPSELYRLFKLSFVIISVDVRKI